MTTSKQITYDEMLEAANGALTAIKDLRKVYEELAECRTILNRCYEPEPKQSFWRRIMRAMNIGKGDDNK